MPCHDNLLVGCADEDETVYLTTWTTQDQARPSNITMLPTTMTIDGTAVTIRVCNNDGLR